MSFTDSAKKLGESAKNFGGSFGAIGGNTASGAQGLTGVAKFGGKVIGFFASIPMFFARKGLDVGAGLNRNPVTGSIIGAGILAGAVYGVYKTARYAMGYRDEKGVADAASAEQQLANEQRRGAMLNAHLQQAAAQDDAMYRKVGTWTKDAPQPAGSKAQAVSEQSAATPTQATR